MSYLGDVLAWYLSLLALGFIGWRVSRFALHGLPWSSRWGLRYPTGVLAVGTVAWWLSIAGAVPCSSSSSRAAARASAAALSSAGNTGSAAESISYCQGMF